MDLPHPGIQLGSPALQADGKLGGGGLVVKSCLTLVTPLTLACQAPLSMGFSGQEYWSGLPFPCFIQISLPVEKKSTLKEVKYPSKHLSQPSCEISKRTD